MTRDNLTSIKIQILVNNYNVHPKVTQISKFPNKLPNSVDFENQRGYSS